MKKLLLTGTVLTMLFAFSVTAMAGEFDRGFKNELGAIGARTAVGIIFDGLFQQQPVNTDSYLDPGYRARIVPRRRTQYQQNYQSYPQTTTVQYVPVQQPVQTQSVSSATGISFAPSTQFNISQVINQLQSNPSATVSWNQLQKILARSVE